jgi:hypothetical protein
MYLSIHPFLLLPLSVLGFRETLRFTSVAQPQTDGRTPRTADQPDARPLLTQVNTNTE